MTSQKFFVLLSFLLFVSCMTGCRTELTVVPPTREISSTLSNKVETKEPGSVMISKIDGQYYNGFKINQDFKPIPTSGLLSIIKYGGQCFVFATMENGDYVCALTGWNRGYHKNNLMIDKKTLKPYGNASCILFSVGSAYTDEIIPWKNSPPDDFLKSTKIYSNGSSKIEIIYSGISNDIIKFKYVEYLNDFTKPAKSQILEFDLKESKNIEINDIKIKIIDATNRRIKFVAL